MGGPTNSKGGKGYSKGGKDGKGKDRAYSYSQQDGKGKDRAYSYSQQDGKSGKGKQEWQPKWDEWQPKGDDVKGGSGGKFAGSSEHRSQLNSSASEFKPASLATSGFGDYGGYDAMAAQYWGWQQPAVQSLPTLWKEYADKDGSKYYYNSKTGLTQWERPAELDPPKPAVDAPSVSNSYSSPSGLGAAAFSSAPSGKGSREGKGFDASLRRDREDELRRTDKDELRRMRTDDGGKGAGGKARRRKGDDGNGKGGGGGGGGCGGLKDANFGPPGCNLFVFHLPDDWTDEDLLEYFAPHGNVVSAKVMKELGTGRSRGFGFVSYEDRVSAATAVKKMQGYKILGKRLKVEFKKGEGPSERDGGEFPDDEGSRRNGGDDERLIGYLRAISAKNVVQSLKASERASPAEGGHADEDDDQEETVV